MEASFPTADPEATIKCTRPKHTKKCCCFHGEGDGRGWHCTGARFGGVGAPRVMRSVETVQFFVFPGARPRTAAVAAIRRCCACSHCRSANTCKCLLRGTTAVPAKGFFARGRIAHVRHRTASVTATGIYARVRKAQVREIARPHGTWPAYFAHVRSANTRKNGFCGARGRAISRTCALRTRAQMAFRGTTAVAAKGICARVRSAHVRTRGLQRHVSAGWHCALCARKRGP